MYAILYSKKQTITHMPSLKYIKNKPNIEKWVANNKEKYYAIQYRNIKRRRAYLQQAKILRSILIDLI